MIRSQWTAVNVGVVRADKIIEDYLAEHNQLNEAVDGWSNAKMEEFVKDKALPRRNAVNPTLLPSDNST